MPYVAECADDLLATPATWLMLNSRHVTTLFSRAAPRTGPESLEVFHVKRARATRPLETVLCSALDLRPGNYFVSALGRLCAWETRSAMHGDTVYLSSIQEQCPAFQLFRHTNVLRHTNGERV